MMNTEHLKEELIESHGQSVSAETSGVRQDAYVHLLGLVYTHTTQVLAVLGQLPDPVRTCVDQVLLDMANEDEELPEDGLTEGSRMENGKQA